jgi:tRNA-2-methylthio-N6-dimethylallyladenosine synthase
MKFYIETFGCQMNDRDSLIMTQILEQAGYSCGSCMTDADVMIINTCSIRGKAEQKAYSLIGSLRKHKQAHPGTLLIVAGCVAQQEGRGMVSRMNHVDMVLGPQAIYGLADHIEQVKKTGKRLIATDQSKKFHIPPFLPDVHHSTPHKRFVTIMQGCNNYCTYCIVPFVRGREVSRSPQDILDEVQHLIGLGVKEITLLGQNVNSYGLDQPKESRTSFPQLLRLVSAINGLVRLRFTTSNPKDLSADLMDCFRDLDNLCPHFHLPMQSGSDLVLERMNRKYTVAEYLSLVAGLRKVLPDISITTDVIVGFPNETDADFMGTMALMEQVRYDSAFSFIYSNRPPALSCDFADEISKEEKSRRLALFQKRQKEITVEQHQRFVGREFDLMIEGESKMGHGQWSGRLPHNIIVNFYSDTQYKPGDMVRVVVTEGLMNSLRAELV